jgi:two-component system, OmpR family, phosphate regulon sensor histidine kinase PhoR
VTLGFRARLFLVFFGLIALALVATDLLVTNRLVLVVVDGIRDDLYIRLDLIQRDVTQAGLAPNDLPAWEALADSLGRSAQARVTIIGRDGVVRGDSEVSAALIPMVQNHADRPEVVDALAHGRGSAIRWSETVRKRMMYVARPFRHDREVAGVVRAAVPLTAVDNAVTRFRTMVVLSSVFALGVAVALSSLAAGWMSRSVRALTAVAKCMAAGDLSGHTGATGRDELAELSRALDQLARNLSRSLTQLRSERDLQEHILNDMGEGVILLGPDGRVAMVNPALREMWLMGADPVGRLPLEITRQAEIHGLFERARRSETAQSAEIELGGLRPRRLLAHAAPLTGGSGGILGVFVDVTDLRRLETVRRDFVANVSHELRTPVATIRSAAETLRDSARSDPEASATFLSIIERNAERMGRLVDDLLELSRIEAGEYRLQMEPLSLAEGVEQVLAAHRAAAAEKRIRLSAALPAPLPAVKADRSALEQILTNLVGNALKYSPEEASVTIHAEASGDRVVVSVEDTGPGIDPQHLPRLFERFYRADTGRARELGGTGLGLSIVRHLVEAMGGQVGVESAPGVGSVFRFDLPVARGNDVRIP